MSDSLQSDFLRSLLGALESTMRQSEKNLMERMDRVDKSVSDLQKNVAELDKQVALMNERQSHVGVFKQDIETRFTDLDHRLEKIEEENFRISGAVRVIKILASVGTGGGVVTVIWNWLMHLGGH